MSSARINQRASTSTSNTVATAHGSNNQARRVAAPAPSNQPRVARAAAVRAAHVHAAQKQRAAVHARVVAKKIAKREAAAAARVMLELAGQASSHASMSQNCSPGPSSTATSPRGADAEAAPRRAVWRRVVEVPTTDAPALATAAMLCEAVMCSAPRECEAATAPEAAWEDVEMCQMSHARCRSASPEPRSPAKAPWRGPRGSYHEAPPTPPPEAGIGCAYPALVELAPVFGELEVDVNFGFAMWGAADEARRARSLGLAGRGLERGPERRAGSAEVWRRGE